VLGAVLLVPASDYIVAELGAAQLYLFGVGLLLAVLVLTLPEGIIPTVGRLLARRGPEASSIREESREELVGSGSGSS
jgi:branched-chain amino acid transport system permease protein